MVTGFIEHFQIVTTSNYKLAVYRQSVLLGAKPLEDKDQRFFLSEPL
jgi:hypothetical protein